MKGKRRMKYNVAVRMPNDKEDIWMELQGVKAKHAKEYLIFTLEQNYDYTMTDAQCQRLLHDLRNSRKNHYNECLRQVVRVKGIYY